YLLQFYLNIKNPHLPCIHLLIHLLKTLEICNYAFNVFISVVAGKQARSELSKMLYNSLIKCFSVDETTDTPTTELTSFSLRYCDESTSDIREDFITFIGTVSCTDEIVVIYHSTTV
ncbi:unnamed protein product, partial [Didymodactylos carnosus]